MCDHEAGKPITEAFTESWAVLASLVCRNAQEKGFNSLQHEAISIALMHSELSEALEHRRHGNPPDDKIPEFSGMEAELADCVIRIMDFGQARGLRIAEAVVAKIDYNRLRPHKHGGKEF